MAARTRPLERPDIVADACATTAQPAGATGMSLLLRLQAAQHVCRYEDYAFFGDVKAFRVCLSINPDLHAVGNLATFIENGSFDDTGGSDFDMRQYDRAIDAGALVHPHIGEQQGRADDGPGDDAAAGDYGVDGGTPPTFLVEHELRRRLLHLVGPDGPVLIVNVELRFHVHQLEVGVVVRIDGSDIAPVTLCSRLHVLERVGKHLQVVANGFRQNVLAEVMRGAAVGRILEQQLFQQPRVEYVDSHGGQDRVGAARQRIGHLRLLGELGHPVPLRGGEHAEVDRVGRGHFHHTNRDVSPFLNVIGDHRTVVHLVDVIARQHEHVLGTV